MTHSFAPWPKIARLNRDITITEKIDGTNSAVGIERVMPDMEHALAFGDLEVSDLRRTNTTAIVLCEDPDSTTPVVAYWVWAQSRKRVITPGKSTDNFGFAGWVAEHAETLVSELGEGLHFGEWWGYGIQRGYETNFKAFSLFNTHRYANLAGGIALEDETVLNTVPVLYQGPFGQFHIDAALHSLHDGGSKAAPGYHNPEGIIVYHSAASTMFKVTLEGDESPKGLMQHG
jgi:hypothetical protein